MSVAPSKLLTPQPRLLLPAVVRQCLTRGQPRRLLLLYHSLLKGGSPYRLSTRTGNAAAAGCCPQFARQNAGTVLADLAAARMMTSLASPSAKSGRRNRLVLPLYASPYHWTASRRLRARYMTDVSKYENAARRATLTDHARRRVEHPPPSREGWLHSAGGRSSFASNASQKTRCGRVVVLWVSNTLTRAAHCSVVL